MIKRNNTTHAFTLIELSIVLVIIGLIVGGVLVGRDLIRAAELRSVISENHRYVTAVATFRDKYSALPGDMVNATSFWGVTASCPGTNVTPSTTAATCNGNGDEMINPSATSNEHFRFWQHLANANMIEGKYTGVEDSGGSNIAATLGKNVPASKLSNGGWYAMQGWGEVLASNTNLFEGTYNAIFMFGGANGGGYTQQNILSAKDTFSIDSKMDDGKPGIGRVRIFERDTNCHDGGVQTTPVAETARYSLSNSAPNTCTIFINM